MPRTYISGTSHVEYRRVEHQKQLTSPPYNPELEKLIKDRKRMEDLYGFISFAKWEGNAQDKLNIPKWENELRDLEDIFLPHEKRLV